MFVVNPGPQPVLRTITDKEHYFAVRRLLALRMCPNSFDLQVLTADRLLTVGVKETPTLSVHLQSPLQVSACLIVAMGQDIFRAPPQEVSQGIYGWATALSMDCGEKFSQLDMPIAASALRPAGKASDIWTSDMWLYVNNRAVTRVDFKQMRPGLLEAISQLSQSARLKTADALLIEFPKYSVAISSGDTVRAGVSGVGMLTVGIRQK